MQKKITSIWKKNNSMPITGGMKVNGKCHGRHGRQDWHMKQGRCMKWKPGRVRPMRVACGIMLAISLCVCPSNAVMASENGIAAWQAATSHMDGKTAGSFDELVSLLDSTPSRIHLTSGTPASVLYYKMGLAMREFAFSYGMQGMTYDDFNLKGYSMVDDECDGTGADLVPAWRDDMYEKAAVFGRVGELAAGLVADGDAETVANVHDYICSTVAYDYGALENPGGIQWSDSAWEALYNGMAVCTGYAQAFQAFMEGYGIPSYVVTGIKGGQWHAWNVVEVDGQWYHVDCTWDASLSEDGDVCHDWLLSGSESTGNTMEGGVILSPSGYGW